MNSQGKLLAPKPIRKCATAFPLKPSRSIACSNTDKNNNYNNKNTTDNNSQENKNNLFYELADKNIPKKPSNLSFPEDKVSFGSDQDFEKKNFVSYKEFRSEIDNEFAKQSATFEILSILSNSKRSLRELNDYSNFNSDFKKQDGCNNNKRFDFNGSITDIDHEYFDEEEKGRLDKSGFYPCKNEREAGKSSDAKDPRLNYHNNPFECKKENTDSVVIANNFLNKFSNEKIELQIITNMLNCLNDENEKCEQENFNKKNNLFQSGISMESHDDFQRTNDLLAKIKTESTVSPSKHEINSSNGNLKKDHAPLSNLMFKEFKKEKQGDRNIINDTSLKEKQNKEKQDSSAFFTFDYNTNNLADMNDHSKSNNINNVFYFIEENFFLELQNEKFENCSFTNSMDKSNKFSNTEQLPNKSLKSSVPIRCKNPFLGSLKNEGINKINKFFSCGETEDQSIFEYKPYQRSIQNFLFSEKANFQTNKINTCKI